MHDGNWHDGMGSGNWWWIPMMIVMVAVWGGLIWAGVTFLKRNHGTSPLPAPVAPMVAVKPSAQEILAERLARGEIEIDDYRRRLDALGHGG